MNPIRLVFCTAVFVAMLLQGPALFADNGPPNACLMIPEIQNGQNVDTNDYQPESCIT
jgi:hypothetical protein